MKKPNIIIFSIDTLRADHVSSYGYHRPTTVNLDRFAAEGALFSNAYSTAVWTPPAHASMVTGLYPSGHATVDYKSLSPRIPTIAQTLARHGYQTAGFVNNPAVGAFVGLERGYQEFHEIWKGVTSKNLLVRGGHFLYRKTLERMRRLDQGARQTQRLVREWFQKQYSVDQPFYMFIHHIEPHNPLSPPKPFHRYFNSDAGNEKIDREKVALMAENPLAYFTDALSLTAAENQALLDLYDCEIAYVDHIMGNTLALFREYEVLNNSLIFVTADHGEHFGEHGLYSHVSSLYEPIVHIPFLIRYPQLYQPAVYDNPVQHVDIFPTILQLLELEPRLCHSLPGQSLLPQDGRIPIAPDRPVFAEWEGRIPEYIKYRLKNDNAYANKVERFTHKFSMVKVNSKKYIYIDDGEEELYDLSFDPEEKNNLAPREPDTCTAMMKLLQENLSIQKSKAESGKRPKDELVLQRLKDLGYI